MVSSSERTRTNEGFDVQDVPRCIFCGVEGAVLYRELRDPLLLAPGVWGMLRCPNCGLAWLNPRPLLAELARLYERYHTHERAATIRSRERLRRLVRDSILARSLGYPQVGRHKLRAALGVIASSLGPVREAVELGVMRLKAQANGRLLDVGCGGGYFLATMRELGWDVAGVEPDHPAARVAAERFALPVYEGTLEEARFPDGYFDAITLNHVIEHLWDPVGTLRECHRVLKPGGRLVAVTPNLDSLGHRIFHEEWRGLEVPRHMYLFSVDTLALCARQSGLVILGLETPARGARWMWANSRMLRWNRKHPRNRTHPGTSPSGIAFRIWLEGIGFQLLEYGLGRRMRIGEEVVLIATK